MEDTVPDILSDDMYMAPDHEAPSSFEGSEEFKHREEVSSQKLYYRISEVARMFKIQASTIRFWEKEFDILKPRKNSKGTRFFSQQDIDHIALIYHYVKERHLTLEGARQKIRENREDAENTFQIVQSLKKVRAMLMEIKANIGE
jgi:DNA-binding transcriptional MerR regulator